MDDNDTSIDAAAIAAQTQGPGEYIEIFGLRVRADLVRRQLGKTTRQVAHWYATRGLKRR